MSNKEIDNIFIQAKNFSNKLNGLIILKQKIITERRKKAQNNFFTKRRKSEAMKKYWKTKKKKEKQEKENEKLQYEYMHESCYCHLGNPPCSFCTDSNYCEDCDIKTLESECPKCGKNIEKE